MWIYKKAVFCKAALKQCVLWDTYTFDLNVWLEKKMSTWDLRRAVMNGKSNCFISICSSFMTIIFLQKTWNEYIYIHTYIHIYIYIYCIYIAHESYELLLGHLVIFYFHHFFWKELWWSRCQIKWLRFRCFFRSFLKLDSHWHFLLKSAKYTFWECVRMWKIMFKNFKNNYRKLFKNNSVSLLWSDPLSTDKRCWTAVINDCSTSACVFWRSRELNEPHINTLSAASALFSL